MEINCELHRLIQPCSGDQEKKEVDLDSDHTDSERKAGRETLNAKCLLDAVFLVIQPASSR